MIEPREDYSLLDFITFKNGRKTPERMWDVWIKTVEAAEDEYAREYARDLQAQTEESLQGTSAEFRASITESSFRRRRMVTAAEDTEMLLSKLFFTLFPKMLIF